MQWKLETGRERLVCASAQMRHTIELGQARG